MADPPHDPHCIFCKIVRGEIPSARVLETDEAVAFLDINPLNPGHTLLVPQVAPRQPGRAARGARRRTSARCCPGSAGPSRRPPGADGLNVIVNNGRAAGQTIDHCHWHIIPRFPDDPVHWPWPQGKCTAEELSRITSRIRNELQPDGSDRDG